MNEEESKKNGVGYLDEFGMERFGTIAQADRLILSVIFLLNNVPETTFTNTNISETYSY